MNILFITHYSALYGANKSLLNLLEGLEKYNIHPLLVVPEFGEICEVLEKKNIPYIIQNFNWWCGVLPKLPKNRFKRIIAIGRNWRLNHNRKKNNLKYLKFLNEKTANFNPDFIYSNSSVFNFGLLYGKKYNIPHIWYLRESQEQYYLNWFYRLTYINKTFNTSEIILAVSNFLKENYYKKNKIQNIKVLYNGVLGVQDLLKLDQLRKAKSENKSENIVFGIVGLLHPKKGQEDAIRAFNVVIEQYPDSKLLIVGMGDQTSLKKLVNEPKLTGSVEFWGHISDPYKAFLEMDVCLMCSRMEGLGRVTIEAMASNIPVIGYKEGGTVELIEENINGLFYEADYKELAVKMIYMIKNKEQRINMGNKGREIFEQKYTSEIYAENFYRILTKFNK
ncbi:MAG TPA: glycosyltransferase family 4 protein [Lutibacter sp.]